MAKAEDLRKYLMHRIDHERGKSVEVWNAIREETEMKESIVKAVIESAKGM